MASRLEELVKSREGSRTEKKQLLEKLLIDNEQETGDLGEMSDAYKDFFLYLKAATSGDDIARSIQFLNARNIAKELISRLSSK